MIGSNKCIVKIEKFYGLNVTKKFYLGNVTKKPKEIEERGETKEETDVEIHTTSKTNWSKHKQTESIEDPSQFPFSEEKSSLPLPQHVAECSSLVTPGILFVFLSG